MSFDVDRAFLRGPDQFPRFVAPEDGTPLVDMDLDDDTMLAVIEEGEQVRAFLLPQLAHHHMAQGEISGKPYLVTF